MPVVKYRNCSPKGIAKAVLVQRILCGVLSRFFSRQNRGKFVPEFAWRTTVRRGSVIQSGFFVKSSSCAIELDAWEVTTAGGELEFHFQDNSRLALDQCLRLGTR